MSKGKQVKINKTLHEHVKDFVNSDSTYSSYKSFYEEAVRRHLEREKGEITEADKEVIREIVDEELEH